MSPRTVERVDDWNSVPFDGGYEGLRDLASQEFSGVVTSGPTRLFMIRGTVVGVLEGSLDDFEESSGNAREAPHPSLPLLAVMQERSDEIRAKYYTEDTPIADVDRTLSDGSFTGYVELSENVLSGDYYQVYHQGRSMSVAYVGSSQRLITDDDAFDQANGEVGIFEVRPVPIEAIDVPEPADDADEDAVAGAGAGADPSAAATDEPAAKRTSAEAPSESPSDDASSGDEDSVEIPSASSDPDAVEAEAADAGATETDGADANSGEPASTSEPTDPEQTPGNGSDDASPTPTDESSTAEPSDAAASSGTARSDERPDDTHPAAPSSTEEPSDRKAPSPTEASSSQESPGADEQSSTDRGRTADAGSSESRSSAGSEQTNQRTDTADRSQQGTRRDQSTSEQTHPASGTSSGPTGQSTDSAAGSGAKSQRSGGSPSPDSATDLETRSIPSLDPARTEAASKARAKQQGAGRNGGTSQGSQSAQSQPQRQSQQPQQSQSQKQSRQSSPKSRDDSSGQGTPTQESGGSSQHPAQPPSEQSAESTPERGAGGSESSQETSASGAQVAELASELEAREQDIEDLRTDLERVEAERDELETELTDIEAERDRLESELEESQAEIDRLNERLEDFTEDGGSTAGTQLSAGEAVDNTNLFVRYNSKGDATLETAHAGDADRSAVADNMRLEYHTQFDADDASVGNETFDDFLTGTIQYRFVDWIVSSLLYEVRDTGHADAMADLYNALPKIDRAELNGQVAVNYSEDGEEHRSQERFDVVVRDRMGNALVVANINDSRDPATDGMMTDLIKRAERVGASGDTLAGAFLVTESFFEPEALETAEESTTSGLFSRDKRKSFVNLSRKGGFHLCLVEARNNEFHLAVPEL